MKNILFNVELLDRHYAFYLDDETNNLYGFAVKRNHKAYFITKGNEISFMNKIIDFLNEKYIRRNDVLYKNEYLERYINRYNKMSYFARKNEDKVTPVSYEEASDLYDFYNKPKTLYIGRKRNAGRQGAYRGYGGEDPFSSSSSYGQYNPYGSSSHFSSSDPYYNIQYQNNRNRRNKRPPLKIIFAIAGTAATISLSALGIKFLIDGGKFPFITKSQIEQQFGEVDITADEESEKDLQTKYESIQKQLEEQDFENWEISKELDEIAFFEGDSSDINFYYDSEKNEVVFVYEDLERTAPLHSEEKAMEEDTSSPNIPEGVEEILETIANNDNLTDEEKTFIAGSVLDTLVENAEYLNYDELNYRYRILDINYEYHEYGKDVSGQINNSPYESALAQYSLPISYTQYESMREFVEKYDISEDDIGLASGKISVFNGTDLNSSIENSKTTIPHELRTCKWKF